jgi:hypothetical protein
VQLLALLGCLDHSLSENSVNFKAVIMSWEPVYVEPYLTPCTSFVLGLLIFK